MKETTSCGQSPSFPIHLVGGTFGAHRFHLIELDYSEAMLQSRVRRANPNSTFHAMFDEFPVESRGDLLRFMESRKGWNITLEKLKRLWPELARLL